MSKISDAIYAVFPELEGREIVASMTLGDIPNWDSMNSVNLQLALEERYGVQLGAMQLRPTDTVEDLEKRLDQTARRGGP